MRQARETGPQGRVAYSRPSLSVVARSPLITYPGSRIILGLGLGLGLRLGRLRYMLWGIICAIFSIHERSHVFYVPPG